MDDQVLPIIQVVFKLVIYGGAILWIIGEFGYDIGPLLAGAGIGGIAVALALNDLGLEFMLTFMAPYFNLSLNLQQWDLIISDANSVSPLPLHSFLLPDPHLKLFLHLLLHQ